MSDDGLDETDGIIERTCDHCEEGSKNGVFADTCPYGEDGHLTCPKIKAAVDEFQNRRVMNCRICQKECAEELCPSCKELNEVFKRAEAAERRYLAFRKVVREL